MISPEQQLAAARDMMRSMEAQLADLYEEKAQRPTRESLAEMQALTGLACEPIDRLTDALAKNAGATRGLIVADADAQLTGQLANQRTALGLADEAAADTAISVALSELRLVKDDFEIEQMRVACDVTARKEAEAALRESEARFRRVFSNNMVPMGLWTQGGAIVDANDALLGLLGRTRAELEAGAIRWDEDAANLVIDGLMLDIAELGRVAISGTLGNATADLFADNASTSMRAVRSTLPSSVLPATSGVKGSATDRPCRGLGDTSARGRAQGHTEVSRGSEALWPPER